jgi:hypothetical protein
MKRIESNAKFCNVMRHALEGANMERCIMRITISDGKVTMEREDDTLTFDEDIFEACDYILENADDDELLNVQQTLESEMEERGLHRYAL